MCLIRVVAASSSFDKGTCHSTRCSNLQLPQHRRFAFTGDQATQPTMAEEAIHKKNLATLGMYYSNKEQNLFKQLVSLIGANKHQIKKMGYFL